MAAGVLRTGAGSDLEELFRDTIGPPQGTLTAIFLENAAPRKEKFDRLLGITEYREAAEGLRDVRSLFEQQAQDAEKRAAQMEGDVRRLPEVESRQQVLTRRRADLAAGLATQLQRQTEMIASREKLEKAQAAVQRAQLELKVAENRAVEARRRQEELAAELRRTEAAARQVEESRQGAQAYQEAVNLLKQLEERRKQRDGLRQRAEMASRNALQWEHEVRSAREKLEALEKDEARATERETLLPEQESRELAVKQAEERVRSRVEATRESLEVEKRLQDRAGSTERGQQPARRGGKSEARAPPSWRRCARRSGRCGRDGPAAEAGVGAQTGPGRSEGSRGPDGAAIQRVAGPPGRDRRSPPSPGAGHPGSFPSGRAGHSLGRPGRSEGPAPGGAPLQKAGGRRSLPVPS